MLNTILIHGREVPVCFRQQKCDRRDRHPDDLIRDRTHLEIGHVPHDAWIHTVIRTAQLHPITLDQALVVFSHAMPAVCPLDNATHHPEKPIVERLW